MSYLKFKYQGLLILFFSVNLLHCQQRNANPLDSIIEELYLEFPSINNNPDAFEIQIRYTQIDKIGDEIKLTPYEYNVDVNRYFYPASTVKMPVAFLALEKLHKLQDSYPEITIDAPISFSKAHESQSSFDTIVSGNVAKAATLRRMIQQIFSVSDNNAYNRLFEFLGRDSINSILTKKGIFQGSTIRHRVGVSGFDNKTNGLANPFSFIHESEKIYSENLRKSEIESKNTKLTHTHKGIGFYIDKDTTDYNPFDMSLKNHISIQDLETSLIAILFPDFLDSNQRFDIDEEKRKFLLQSMARLPREYDFPVYDQKEYYDSYGKFFLFGDRKDSIPDHIRIFNKVGYAYGTLTDCAFIVDLEREVAFFLTATILVNKNQIFNDGIYEYDEIGIPFLASLGRKILKFESERSSHPIDFHDFRLNYKEE